MNVRCKCIRLGEHGIKLVRSEGFSNVKLLGTFETNFVITDMWDHIFKLFNDNNLDGIFVRKEKIC